MVARQRPQAPPLRDELAERKASAAHIGPTDVHLAGGRLRIAGAKKLMRPWETSLVPPGWREEERVGLDVLAAGRVDGPPSGPWRRDVRYPLALDIDAGHGIAAVSFAILDMYPDIQRGWWCEAVTFSLRDGGWRYAAGESDNCTTPDPFARPSTSTNSVHAWCDWHSNGGLGEWGGDDLPQWRHTFFGLAPSGTARLTVTDETGATRDLPITPWNGAYVAVVAGAHSTLTGFDQDGHVLGSFMPMDGQVGFEIPRPAPGWHRDETSGGNLLFQRDEPS